MKNTWSFKGMFVFPNRHIPEFVPVLSLPECGCSSNVRDDFNQYLLEQFGQRHFLMAEGDAYCHPNTFEWFKEQNRDK